MKLVIGIVRPEEANDVLEALYRPGSRSTLDVLAAHGTAGLVGILFVGFFAEAAWNGVGDGLFYGDAAQLGHQALAAVVTPVYAFTVTFALLRLIGLFTLPVADPA